jgi:hypothetical protein
MTTANELRAAYQPGIAMLPAHMHEGVVAYIEHGRNVGGFLTSLFQFGVDERLVWDRADQVNRACKEDWRSFLADFAPRACWGSPLKCTAWRKMGGLSGYPKGEGP